MIAQALRIHETTVTQHLNDYREEKLTINSGGSNSFLNASQTKELISHLENNTYQCSYEIAAYIKRKHNISYSIPGLNKWLHGNGFSYKKPKGYPYKASKKQQDKFTETYKELKNNITLEDSIMFMDSCHPSMETKITHGWIKKGESEAIETTASRTRVNLVGAINLSKLSNPVVASYTTVDGDTIVDFLSQLRKYSNVLGKIHLVLDQAGYHCSLKVAEAEKKLNIKLLFLPSYSLNLNPIERLWKVMNEHVRNNGFFKTAQEFRQSISDFFSKTLREISGSLSYIINDNFQNPDYAF